MFARSKLGLLAIAAVVVAGLGGGAVPGAATASTQNRPIVKTDEGVAAIAADDIWVVGGDYGVAVIQHWDGTEWQSVPAPAGTSQLYDVDAVSATDVWAVGRYSVIHWDGTAWSRAYLGGFYFYAVSAIGADDVWVVGYDGAEKVSVKLHWNGKKWQDFGKPDPAVGYYGIDGLAANDVWAVGTRSFGAESVLEHWNGHRWKTFPAVRGAALQGTVALSPTDVWFVGWAGTHVLALHWDGTQISRVDAPAPRTKSTLFAVSAGSATDIWAVGQAETPGLRARTLIEHWDGATWSVVKSPDAGHDFTSLLDVDAFAADDALAVGYSQEKGWRYPFMAHWNGTRWTRVF